MKSFQVLRSTRTSPSGLCKNIYNPWILNPLNVTKGLENIEKSTSRCARIRYFEAQILQQIKG